MIYIGIFVLAFLSLHVSDFFWELKFGEVAKITYGEETMHNAYQLVADLFTTNILFDIIYIVGVIALGLHLYHGFWSAFQTLGWSNDKWRKPLSIVGLIYSVIIAGGFTIIPLYFMIFK